MSEIPVSAVMWIAAAFPIIALLILMMRFQWSARQAAPVGLLLSILCAVIFYKANLLLIGTECLKGIWNAFTILIVVWPALLTSEVAAKAKAFQVFCRGMQRLVPNELLQFLMLGWVFVSFLQGITGFGVPVAVGAPLLISMGVSPLWAVITPLIGHAWANTFGTLAMAWDALVLQTGIASSPGLLSATALWATVFIWIWNLISGLAICWFYGRGAAIRKGLPAVLLISLIQGGGQLLLSQVNTTLAAFVPACVAMGAVLLLGRTSLYRQRWRYERSPVMNRGAEAAPQPDSPAGMTMHQAFLPYYALTAISLSVLLIPPVKNLLSRVQFSFAFPETSTGYGFTNAAVNAYSPLSPLTHASFFLLLSAVIGIFFFRRHRWITSGEVRGVFLCSLRKTLPYAVAVTSFIAMSRVMGGSGQTLILAQGISRVLGKGYALFAPLVGMLGSFLTSSNMSSNILFSQFQMTTAQLLNLPAPAILGAQTAGGAIGNTISPGSLILGTTNANIPGKEGVVMSKILPLAILASSAIGLILILMIFIAAC